MEIYHWDTINGRMPNIYIYIRIFYIQHYNCIYGDGPTIAFPPQMGRERVNLLSQELQGQLQTSPCYHRCLGARHKIAGAKNKWGTWRNTMMLLCPDALCMEYLPTFGQFLGWMLVNIPFMMMLLWIVSNVNPGLRKTMVFFGRVLLQVVVIWYSHGTHLIKQPFGVY